MMLGNIQLYITKYPVIFEIIKLSGRRGQKTWILGKYALRTGLNIFFMPVLSVCPSISGNNKYNSTDYLITDNVGNYIYIYILCKLFY